MTLTLPLDVHDAGGVRWEERISTVDDGSAPGDYFGAERASYSDQGTPPGALEGEKNGAAPGKAVQVDIRLTLG